MDREKWRFLRDPEGVVIVALDWAEEDLLSSAVLLRGGRREWMSYDNHDFWGNPNWVSLYGGRSEHPIAAYQLVKNGIKTGNCELMTVFWNRGARPVQVNGRTLPPGEITGFLTEGRVPWIIRFLPWLPVRLLPGMDGTDKFHI